MNLFFNHVTFRGIGNYRDNYRELPGSITFYESPVVFRNSSFDTSFGGDDLLNLVRSEFQISDSNFYNSNADALDADYSNGSLINTKFKNIGNDAVDISTSKLTINNLKIFQVQDKGISAGEDSTVLGENIGIYDTSLPLSCKDMSNMNLNNVEVINSDVVFSVFQKKPEYGPAKCIVKTSILVNIKKII